MHNKNWALLISVASSSVSLRLLRSTVVALLAAGAAIGMPAPATAAPWDHVFQLENHTALQLRFLGMQTAGGARVVASPSLAVGPARMMLFTLTNQQTPDATTRVTYSFKEEGINRTVTLVASRSEFTEWSTCTTDAAKLQCSVRPWTRKTNTVFVLEEKTAEAAKIVASTGKPDLWEALARLCLPPKSGEPKSVSTCRPLTQGNWIWQVTIGKSTYLLDSVTPTSLPSAQIWRPYTAPLTSPIRGGKVFAEAGTLPLGLRADASSKITGTPTQYGTFQVQLMVILDGIIVSRATVPFIVGVDKPTLDTTEFLVGTVGSPYEQWITIRENYTIPGRQLWNITGLPPGLTFDQIGRILGTPTTAGTFPVKVTVTTTGGTATGTIPLTIAPRG